MPARRAKRSTRKTPAKRKGVRKTIVTLKPLKSGEDAAQAKIQELEAENRQLKVQLAEQRNSSTMMSAPLARSERSYKGMAITFAITTVVLLVVVVLLSV
jgi:hypothetical protein